MSDTAEAGGGRRTIIILRHRSRGLHPWLDISPFPAYLAAARIAFGSKVRFMRLGRLVVCAAPLVVLLAGCLWPRTTGGVNWTRSFSVAVGADVIAIEVAVLEVPAGDRFVNTSLFTQIDDQILP